MEIPRSQGEKFFDRGQIICVSKIQTSDLKKREISAIGERAPEAIAPESHIL